MLASAASATPCVCMDFYDETSGAAAVVSDGLLGSSSLTGYLIEMGHRQIGFLGSINATSSIMDRYLGYCKAMILHGLPIRQSWIVPDRDESGEYREYPLPDPLPTAFVCNCDRTAMLFTKRLRALGLKVPRDVSLVGFDDYTETAAISPALTTFAVDQESLARETARPDRGQASRRCRRQRPRDDGRARGVPRQRVQNRGFERSTALRACGRGAVMKQEKRNDPMANPVTIFGAEPLPGMPWQDRPAGDRHDAPIWRYTDNPIIGRNPAPGVARIFNSAVARYQDGYVAVLRGEQTDGVPQVYLGRSGDGIHWTVDPGKVPFTDETGKPFMPPSAYDPRLVKVEDTWYIMWCTDFFGAAIGMAKTRDFKTFTRIENPFLPFNRNAVLFPRKIGGKFKLLSRPSDSGHTPFGDIFVSESAGPHLLGPPPPCDGARLGLVGKPEDRRRRRAHRDQRGMAFVLPRGHRHLLGLRVLHRRRDFGYRRAQHREIPLPQLPADARGAL